MKLSIALLVLLFSIPCFALTPPEVVLVVNSSSTLDTDGNSVSDWRDVVVWYAAAHPDWDTTQVCSVRTYDATIGDEDEPWDFLNATIDTSNLYGTSASKNVNHDYVLDDICATFDSRGWWGQKKCVVLVMGMPLRTQHNATYNATCGSSPGSSIIWSWDDVIRVFARPSLAWSSGWNIDGAWRNGMLLASSNGNLALFIPGKYYNNSLQDTNDSLAQWLLVSRLDGLHVDDVRGMITRAATGTPLTWDGATTWTTPYWAVVDQDTSGDVDYTYTAPLSDTTSSEWGSPNRLRTDLLTSFGSKVLWDSTRGVAGSIPDTITAKFGIGSSQNPAAATLFYWNSSSHGNPKSAAAHYYGIDFTIANGAFALDLGSFNAITMRDTSLRSGSQPLIVEAIQHGFTYSAGNVCEPTTTYYVSPRHAGKAWTNKYTDIATVGQVCTKGLKFCVVLGDPLGIMGRSTVRSVSAQTTGGSGWSSWR